MQARLVKSLAVAAIISGALLLHAKRPISASVDVAPTPIKAGAALGVTSSLTNHSKNAQAVSVSIEMRGPCGVTASRGYKVMMIGGGTDTVKASLSAPTCPGNYEATMVLSDHDGSILGTANAHFQVLPRETAIAAGK